MHRITICLTALLILLASSVVGVVLPPNWERLTCKIQTEKSGGTGFILRYKGEVFIVTNKHVVQAGISTFNIGLRVQLPDSTGGSSDPSQQWIKPGTNLYFADPLYDLEFVRITKFAGLFDIAVTPESMVGHDSMIVAGREVFFLGYPGGITGYDSKVPLVRSAIIAGDFEHTIILDGNIFGGSSGSPIFLNPDLENHVKSQYLIGIVAGLAGAPIRTMTKETPALSEVSEGKPPQATVLDTIPLENIGIGIGIKVGHVINTIENWMQAQDK